jgi:hypothetical protein
MKEESKTDVDFKLTGKQIFEEKNKLGTLGLEEFEEDEDEEFKDEKGT